jgi:hypothetical protein
MSCDSFYSIGDKHQVCQDYALHGELAPDLQYAIVADGCSSAEHSEIGAQILCHAAKYQIALSYQSGLFHECSLKSLSCMLSNSILKRIQEVRLSYPISSKALEATLFIALYAPSKVFVFGWGDGVIIEHYRLEGLYNGTEFDAVTEIDFSGNAPFYLVCDREHYLKDLQGKGYDDPQTTLTHHYQNVVEGKRGEIDLISRDKPTDGSPYRWCLDMNNRVHPDRKLISVTVCSDGVKSFQDMDKKPVKLMDIVPEVIGYKSTEGEFVKKRMFFLKRKAQKNNWSHFDDIGCGTIFIN